MKVSLISLLLFISIFSQGQILEKIQVRQMYFEGWEGECGAEELVEMLSTVNLHKNPLLMAYHGAATSTLANCKWNPYSKLAIFNEGKKKLEQAVQLAPKNIEIRFLRFTIQTNIPSLLAYDNIKEDKKILLKALTLGSPTFDDEDLTLRIIDYLVISKDLSEEESLRLKKHLAAENENKARNTLLN